jgi:hypothetical protein
MVHFLAEWSKQKTIVGTPTMLFPAIGFFHELLTKGLVKY